MLVCLDIEPGAFAPAVRGGAAVRNFAPARLASASLSHLGVSAITREGGAWRASAHMGGIQLEDYTVSEMSACRRVISGFTERGKVLHASAEHPTTRELFAGEVAPRASLACGELQIAFAARFFKMLGQYAEGLTLPPKANISDERATTPSDDAVNEPGELKTTHSPQDGASGGAATSQDATFARWILDVSLDAPKIALPRSTSYSKSSGGESLVVDLGMLHLVGTPILCAYDAKDSAPAVRYELSMDGLQASLVDLKVDTVSGDASLFGLDGSPKLLVVADIQTAGGMLATSVRLDAPALDLGVTHHLFHTAAATIADNLSEEPPRRFLTWADFNPTVTSRSVRTSSQTVPSAETAAVSSSDTNEPSRFSLDLALTLPSIALTLYQGNSRNVSLAGLAIVGASVRAGMDPNTETMLSAAVSNITLVDSVRNVTVIGQAEKALSSMVSELEPWQSPANLDDLPPPPLFMLDARVPNPSAGISQSTSQRSSGRSSKSRRLPQSTDAAYSGMGKSTRAVAVLHAPRVDLEIAFVTDITTYFVQSGTTSTKGTSSSDGGGLRDRDVVLRLAEPLTLTDDVNLSSQRRLVVGADGPGEYVIDGHSQYALLIPAIAADDARDGVMVDVLKDCVLRLKGTHLVEVQGSGRELALKAEHFVAQASLEEGARIVVESAPPSSSMITSDGAIGSMAAIASDAGLSPSDALPRVPEMSVDLAPSQPPPQAGPSPATSTILALAEIRGVEVVVRASEPDANANTGGKRDEAHALVRIMNISATYRTDTGKVGAKTALNLEALSFDVCKRANGLALDSAAPPLLAPCSAVVRWDEEADPTPNRRLTAKFTELSVSANAQVLSDAASLASRAAEGLAAIGAAGKARGGFEAMSGFAQPCVRYRAVEPGPPTPLDAVGTNAVLSSAPPLVRAFWPEGASGQKPLGCVLSPDGSARPPAMQAYTVPMDGSSSRFPLRFELLGEVDVGNGHAYAVWEPVPKEGYAVSGYAFTAPGDPPPPVNALCCLRSTLATPLHRTPGLVSGRIGVPLTSDTMLTLRRIVNPSMGIAVEGSDGQTRAVYGLLARRCAPDAAAIASAAAVALAAAQPPPAAFPVSEEGFPAGPPMAPTGAFRRMWWSRGLERRNGNVPSASIWRPEAPPGFRIYGDVLVEDYHPPVFVVVPEWSPPLTAEPTGFELVWSDGSGGYNTPSSDHVRPSKTGPAGGFALWRPLAPEGYVAVGLFASAHAMVQPDVKLAACVRRDCLDPSARPQGQQRMLWSRPARSGAYPSIVLWGSSDEQGTFWATRDERQAPPSGAPRIPTYWKLTEEARERAIAPLPPPPPLSISIDIERLLTVVRTRAVSPDLIRLELKRTMMRGMLGMAGESDSDSGGMRVSVALCICIYALNPEANQARGTYEPLLEDLDVALNFESPSDATSTIERRITPGVSFASRATVTCAGDVRISASSPCIAHALKSLVDLQAATAAREHELAKHQASQRLDNLKRKEGERRTGDSPANALFLLTGRDMGCALHARATKPEALAGTGGNELSAGSCAEVPSVNDGGLYVLESSSASSNRSLLLRDDGLSDISRDAAVASLAHIDRLFFVHIASCTWQPGPDAIVRLGGCIRATATAELCIHRNSAEHLIGGVRTMRGSAKAKSLSTGEWTILFDESTTFEARCDDVMSVKITVDADSTYERTHPGVDAAILSGILTLRVDDCACEHALHLDCASESSAPAADATLHVTGTKGVSLRNISKTGPPVDTPPTNLSMKLHTATSLGVSLALSESGPWTDVPRGPELECILAVERHNQRPAHVLMSYHEPSGDGKKMAMVEITTPYTIRNETGVPLEVMLIQRANTSRTMEACEGHVEFEMYENQRFQPLQGWGGKGYLLSTETRMYGSRTCSRKNSFDTWDGALEHICHQVLVDGTHKWAPNESWRVDMNGGVDADGWSYATTFLQNDIKKYPPPSSCGKRMPQSFVRRRRWVRGCVPAEASSQASSRGGYQEGGGFSSGGASLGVVTPGETMHVPLWAVEARGAEVSLRPAGETFEWSEEAPTGGALAHRGSLRIDRPAAGTALLFCEPADGAVMTSSSAWWLIAEVRRRTVTQRGAKPAAPERSSEDFLDITTPRTGSAHTLVVRAPVRLRNLLPMRVDVEASTGYAGGATPRSEGMEADPGALVDLHRVDPRRGVYLRAWPSPEQGSPWQYQGRPFLVMPPLEGKIRGDNVAIPKWADGCHEYVFRTVEVGGGISGEDRPVRIGAWLDGLTRGGLSDERGGALRYVTCVGICISAPMCVVNDSGLGLVMTAGMMESSERVEKKSSGGGKTEKKEEEEEDDDDDDDDDEEDDEDFDDFDEDTWDDSSSSASSSATPTPRSLFGSSDTEAAAVALARPPWRVYRSRDPTTTLVASTSSISHRSKRFAPLGSDALVTPNQVCLLDADPRMCRATGNQAISAMVERLALRVSDPGLQVDGGIAVPILRHGQRGGLVNFDKVCELRLLAPTAAPMPTARILGMQVGRDTALDDSAERADAEAGDRLIAATAPVGARPEACWRVHVTPRIAFSNLTSRCVLRLEPGTLSDSSVTGFASTQSMRPGERTCIDRTARLRESTRLSRFGARVAILSTDGTDTVVGRSAPFDAGMLLRLPGKPTVLPIAPINSEGENLPKSIMVSTFHDGGTGSLTIAAVTTSPRSSYEIANLSNSPLRFRDVESDDDVVLLPFSCKGTSASAIEISVDGVEIPAGMETTTRIELGMLAACASDEEHKHDARYPGPNVGSGGELSTTMLASVSMDNDGVLMQARLEIRDRSDTPATLRMWYQDDPTSSSSVLLGQSAADALKGKGRVGSLLLRVKMPGISLSLAGRDRENETGVREVVYLGLQRIEATIASSMPRANGASLTSIGLRLDDLQLDDTLFTSACPVVLRADPTHERLFGRHAPLISLRIASEPSEVHELCASVRQKLLLELHETVLWQIVAFVNELRLDLLSGDDNVEPPPPQSFRVRMLETPGFGLGLTFKADPNGRPEGMGGLISSLGLSFANISGARIRLTGTFSETPREVTSETIVTELVNRAVADVKKHLLRVVMGVDLKNATQGLLGTVSDQLANLGDAKMSDVLGGGGEEGGASSSRGSSHRSGAATNRSDTATGGVKAGVNAFAGGLLKGVTGIFSKPLEGARKGGAVGFAEGVVSGVVGAGGNIASGVVDLASNTAGGIVGEMGSAMNTIAVTVGAKRASAPPGNRLREPRCVGADGALHPYSAHDAEGVRFMLNAVTAGALGGPLLRVNAGLGLNNERYVMHEVLRPAGGPIALYTTMRAVRLDIKDDEFVIVWNVPWNKVSGVDVGMQQQRERRVGRGAGGGSQLPMVIVATSSSERHELLCERGLEQAERLCKAAEELMHA